MSKMNWRTAGIVLSTLVGMLALGAAFADGPTPATEPAKVYVPYEHLKPVLNSEKQGVFLPYDEFQRLWRAAKESPAGLSGQAPMPYLISAARFTGKVGAELATMQMNLTVDILADGWVEVPIGLAEVAVSKASFGAAASAPADAETPLLRVVNGQYSLVTKGKGRRTLVVDFVRQLVTEPGLNVLTFRTPSAAITMLDLQIGEENMKVDVEPMLAATTTQVTADGKKATQLQAFLGAADRVKLSWKPKTQAAEDLEPVVIADQLQQIDVSEAVISHTVEFNYDIRRRGVDQFTIQLPRDFRVIAVDGANIAKWDIVGGAANQTTQPAANAAKAAPATNAADAPVQMLAVKLFAPAKDSYKLTVKMERFLQEAEATVALTPIVTHQALRSTGLIALTHVSRRSVEIRDARNLVRVDAGRLPESLRSRAGVSAYRFLSADYAGQLAIAMVAPRITVNQLWALGVDADRLELRGKLNYTIERAGVFELSMSLPEPWEVISVGPANVVDDHQLVGKGADRKLNLLLKREVSGAVSIDLVARAPRAAVQALRGEQAATTQPAGERAVEPVEFTLPLPASANLQMCTGQLVLFLAGQFRAEIDKLDQLSPLPLERAAGFASMGSLAPALAFEYQAIDRSRPAGAKFRIAAKPAQVSAVVYRLVNIQPGSLEQQAVVEYRVQHAPVDTFYLQVPASLAGDIRIQGKDIKEQPQVDAPEDTGMRGHGDAEKDANPRISASDRLRVATHDSQISSGKFVYYKIVLQAPITGAYTLAVTCRQPFQAGTVDKPALVKVEPILAAGKLSDQNGYVTIAKADTLAIAAPEFKNLTPADPGSETDLPYAPHRQVAVIAFKYAAPPFELTLPVVLQQEADVFTKIVTAAIMEQVIDRQGTLNTHATFLVSSSRGDRLAFTLPARAKVFSVQLNGAEAAVEPGASADGRVVRMPPSAGQVSRVVLEISYGLDNASAADLAGPELPKDIPVQQTIWRLCVPQEDYVIGYDRTFARVNSQASQNLLEALAAGQATKPAFKLAQQGQVWDFTRQGAPGKLSVHLVSRETFHISIWVAVLAIGAFMLRLRGFTRTLIVLAAAVAMSVMDLIWPLLVDQVCLAVGGPVGIVAMLWLAQWIFIRMPRARKEARDAATPPFPVTLVPVQARPSDAAPAAGSVVSDVAEKQTSADDAAKKE